MSFEGAAQTDARAATVAKPGVPMLPDVDNCMLLLYVQHLKSSPVQRHPKLAPSHIECAIKL